MTSADRKRLWRARNPEASSTAERQRAQARRSGYWGAVVLGGDAPRPCRSSKSYARYEDSTKRFMQRMFWPRYGAGTTTMSREEFRAAGAALLAAVYP